VYFFNQLRREIDLEDRYSMLLPRANENASFIDKSDLPPIYVENLPD
jgi:hypothetical protein